MTARPFALPEPAPPEKPRRKSRWTAADFELLRTLRGFFAEFAAGMPIFKRRAELRVLAHQAIDRWFDAKVAKR